MLIKLTAVAEVLNSWAMHISIPRRYFYTLLYMLVFLLAGTAHTFATHLVGGSVSYKYIGRSGNNYRYEITFTIYRDCRIPPGQSSATPFDDPIKVGIYENTGAKRRIKFVGNKIASGYSANETDEDYLKMTRWSERDVTPVVSSNCLIGKDVCMREAIYKAEVVLPPSAYGYHVEYIRCCRNSLVNMPEKTGQTYYTFIAPTSFENTSPTFTDVPIPSICAKDTVSLFNTASDADGDSLVFKIAWPYTGADDVNPMPNPPLLFSSPKVVSYNPGFTHVDPFGSNGLADIDPVTGLTKIVVPSVGAYVIGIDVFEYRNGINIGITRRDIQILVNACPPNNAPKREAINGSMPTTFTVTEGETLSFQLNYKDSENTLTITGSGELFNGGTFPKATISTTQAVKNLLTTVTVPTVCKQARQQPYILNVSVKDDGCPPKSISQSYTIYVKPFKGADSIYGPSPACIGGAGNSYFVKKVNSQSKVVWAVTGGTILSNSGSNIVVRWNNITQGLIKAVEVSPGGCVGDTLKRVIYTYPKPATPIITGQVGVCLGEVYQYQISSPIAGAQYTWLVSGGVPVSGGKTAKESFRWTELDTAEIRVVVKNLNGCYSDTAIYKVVVGKAIIDSIYGSVSVCPNASGVDYWVIGKEGSTFIWKVSGGVQSSGGNTDHIKVDWGEKGGGVIKVIEITAENCVSDTIDLTVVKDYVLITTPIKGKDSVCEFTTGVTYQVLFTNGSTYDWKITGGNITSGQGTSKIMVDWGSAGKGFLTLVETAWDPVNNKPCIGKPISKLITINQLPNPSQVSGPAEICEGDTGIFIISGYKGSTFHWAIDGYGYFTAENGNDTFLLPMIYDNLFDSIAGWHTLTVNEISKEGCQGPERSFKFLVHPLPDKETIFGPGHICQPNFNGIVYTINGKPGSTFNWSVKGGNITAGQGTNTIMVNWQKAGIGEVNVREQSSFGCKGPNVTMQVKVDSLFLEIEKVTTGRNNEEQIEIYWSAKNTQFLASYIRLYRKRDGQGQFALYDSFPIESGVYIDKNVATSNYSYYYYIEAINSCGEKVLSNTHRTVLLHGDEMDDIKSKVYWNRYEGWPGGVEYYYLYKRINNDTTLVYYDVSKLDSFLQVEDALEGYRQCYRVAAVKANDNKIVSWSNSVCFKFDPILWIPNAFTPDNFDGTNDNFKVFVSRYKDFEINIYNRWGEKLFHSTDPNVQWDGTFQGKKCQEDVYMYIVNVHGANKHLYKSGTLHLLR